MATLRYEGFNNIPPTNLSIDWTRYDQAEYVFDAKGNSFEIMTGAQLNQRIIDSGLSDRPVYSNDIEYVVYTGDIEAGAVNDLGSFSLTFKDKATDIERNKYDVRVDYKSLKEETVPHFALDFMVVTGIYGTVTDMSTSDGTGVVVGRACSGGESEIEISVLRNGESVSIDTTMAVVDIDAQDSYNLIMRTPSDTGNGYLAGNGKVWKYQESVNPNTDGDVYLGDGSCLIVDESTGFIGNACSESQLTDNYISSIAFNVTLPHTIILRESSGRIGLFSNYASLRSANIVASKTGEGTISDEGEKYWLLGSNATYTMTPSEGYRIKDVKVDGLSVGAVDTYTFTNIQEDHTIEVEFEAIPTEHTITASTDGNGTITDEGQTTVPDGGSKTYTMKPKSGYVIKDVRVDGVSVGAVSKYTFNNVTEDHTIAVEFEPDECHQPGIIIIPPEDPEGGCCERLSRRVDELQAQKQDKLTAGENITIEKVGDNTVISSTGGVAELFEIVEELPQTGDENKIYLVPMDGGGFTEYHYHDGEWDEIGEVEIDLSNYYTKSQTYSKAEVNTLIEDFLKDSDITKEYLLQKLGYTEIPVSMKVDGVTKNYVFLGKEEESEWVTWATGEYMDGGSCMDYAKLGNMTVTATPPAGAQRRYTINGLVVDSDAPRDVTEEDLENIGGDTFYFTYDPGDDGLYAVNENWDEYHTCETIELQSAVFEYKEV